MKLRLDDLDSFELLSNEWLFEIGCILRKRMLDVGLSKEQSQQACGEILFDIEMLHDQHGLKGELTNAISDPILPRLGLA